MELVFLSMSELFVSLLSRLLGVNEYLFVYDVISFLGGVNVLFAMVAGSLFILRRVNRRVLANENAFIKKLLKSLSKVHPYIGGILLVTAYVHGDLALGTLFKIHTGPLIWWLLFAMMFVALAGKKYRVKPWLKVHRILAACVAFSIILHLTAV